MTPRADLYASALVSAAPRRLSKAAPEILAGTPFFDRHPTFIGHDGLPQIGGFADLCLTEADAVERVATLLHAAYGTTLANLPPDVPGDKTFVLYVALPTWLETGDMRQRFRGALHSRDFGRVARAEYFFGGHVAGLTAMAAAVNGDVDMALVAGADSLVAPNVLDLRAYQGLANTADNPYGVIPAEAGAMHLVTQPGTLKTAPKSRVHSFDFTTEPADLADPDRPMLGAALAQSLNTCIADLPRGEVIGTWLSDMNGERFRAEETGIVLTRCPQLAGLDPCCPCTSIGDLGAATAPSYCAIVPFLQQMPSDYALISMVDPGGERATALVR